ncbi:hypothetical protein OROMI_030672 [Orobanche minor]
MNEYREEGQRWCYFHPRDLVIGVCALCLNERLLVLASKQSHIHQTSPIRKVLLPKIFALTSLINPLYIIHHKSDDVYDDSNSSICSQEDSYISMKFEDNGVVSWDKGKISNNNSNSLDKGNRIKSVVVEKAKPHVALRWRNRIGHLVSLIRWKRSASKSGVCHVGTKLEGSKVKHGWMRILSKRRTKE